MAFHLIVLEIVCIAPTQIQEIGVRSRAEQTDIPVCALLAVLHTGLTAPRATILEVSSVTLLALADAVCYVEYSAGLAGLAVRGIGKARKAGRVA